MSLGSRLRPRAASSRSAAARVPITIPERIAIVVVALVLSVGLIAVLSGFFAGRDQPGVSGSTGPGQAFADLGHAHLAPAEPRPTYNSNPPTSGPHVPEPVLHDQSPLNDDQLLQALEMGNVVLMYGSPTPPAGLATLLVTRTGRGEQRSQRERDERGKFHGVSCAFAAKDPGTEVPGRCHGRRAG